MLLLQWTLTRVDTTTTVGINVEPIVLHIVCQNDIKKMGSPFLQLYFYIDRFSFGEIWDVQKWFQNI